MNQREQIRPAIAELPSLLYLDRRVRRGGRLAREVYVYAVLRDAGCGGAGVVPAHELETDQLVDWMQTPADECERGLEDAIRVGLLARTDAGDVRIVREGERQSAPELPMPVPAAAAVSDDALALGWVLARAVCDLDSTPEVELEQRAHAFGVVFEQMHRRRKAAYAEMAAVLHWCRREPEWRALVTTAAAFRKYYTRMAKARAARRRPAQEATTS